MPLWSTVKGLLGRSGPSAVGRLVIAVIVYPVDGMVSAWALSHVFIEALKGVKPASAHANAAPAVIREVFVRGTRASSNKVTPYPELRRVGQSVNQVQLSSDLALNATAGVRPVKVADLNRFLIAAFAPASVFEVFRVVFDERQNRQSAMLVTNGENGQTVMNGHSHILPYFGLQLEAFGA